MTKKSLAAAAVAVIVIAVWACSLSNGFVYDDHKYLVGNPWVKDTAFTGDIFSSSTSAFSPTDAISNTYRPMLYMLYMAEYLAFGLTPFYFHLVNILAHAVNAVFVFFVAANLLGKEGRGSVFLPLLAGLAFGLHTINTEVVNWVSASTELFFTLFALAGLNLYLRRASGVLSAPFFLVALLFKETAAALALIIFIYDYSKNRLLLRDRWKAYAFFIAAGFVYALMRFNAIGGVMHHKQADLSTIEAFINIFPLVAAYFAKLALPVNLSAIYEFHPARSFLDARVIAGAAFVLAFSAALFFSRRRPAMLVGLSMMAIPLLPVLYVPALSSSAMADRYLYLPSAGLAIVLASVASVLDKKAAKASIVVASALLVAWAAGSISRSQVWRSDHTLWADAARRAPNSPNAHYNYAWASHNAGDLKEAVEHYRRAASLAPSADAHYNLGVIFLGQSMIDEAEFEFRAALGIDPGFDGARGRLMEIKRLRGAGA
ncbi:MAG: tetratricopeptide repeat protein [Deltaproteobacteria bacterium]|nr:tetratricopeptide repeat protein [Deltaproteobacteria bacterium]